MERPNIAPEFVFMIAAERFLCNSFIDTGMYMFFSVWCGNQFIGNCPIPDGAKQTDYKSVVEKWLYAGAMILS